MRRVEKIVGTAFTRRKTTHEVAETPEEIKAVFRQLDDCGDDPWANHRREVESARAALALEIAKKPKGYRFKERDEVGWYLERLIIQGTLVQHHIDQGAASWAAHEAALFGETFCELQLKLAREPMFNSGKGTVEGAKKGAEARRAAVERRNKRIRATYAERLTRQSRTLALQCTAKDYGLGEKQTRRIVGPE